MHHFLRLLFVKLGTQHCPDCDVPIEPQSEEVDRGAADEANTAGRKSPCSRRLIVNRKGVYTDLAKWALAKGYWHLRVDGKLLPTRPFPRIDRFKEHTIELPVGEVVVSAKAETQLRQLLSKALEIGKGVVHVLRQSKEVAGLLHQARLPLVRPQLPGARPAAVLLQLEARLVRGLLRHRAADRRGRVERRARAHRRRGQRARLVDRMAGDRRAPARSATASGSTTKRSRCAGSGKNIAEYARAADRST